MNAMAPTRTAGLTGRRVRLAAGPAAAGQARRHVRAAITTWDIPVDPDTAALLTSELVTNAIRHETGPAITLAISCPPGQLRIDVHDTAPAMPAPADAPPGAEAGRGLMLVAAQCDRWSWQSVPGWPGKVVWAELARRPAPGRDTSFGPLSAPLPG